MDLGFETIGNATVICHDRRPVLATDPWLVGSPYFGSCSLSHEVPPEQMEAVKACSFLSISHGHPDDLSLESLSFLKEKTLLLPDHAGGRIAADLKELGFTTSVLKDRQWTQLSRRIRVCCVADYNQDAILLIDLRGTLLVDLNDAVERGWGPFVKRTIQRFKDSVLLKLFGFGDPDMIHFVDEDGKRTPPPAAQRFSVGRVMQCYAETAGVRYVIPFSSLHRYQRRDSVWANDYTTQLSDYARGFASRTCTLLPAFVRYHCGMAHIEEIAPHAVQEKVREPEEFGDNWSEPLAHEEAEALRRYFLSISHLRKGLDFITFRVGGQDCTIGLRSREFKTGVIFEDPRH